VLAYRDIEYLFVLLLTQLMSAKQEATYEKRLEKLMTASEAGRKV